MRTIISILVLLFSVSCIEQKPKVDLHTAVVTDNLAIIKQHIRAGTDLNIPEPSRQSTPLITAAAAGKTEAAKILIEAGADLNYKNADGSTALHTAAVFGITEIAKELINAGIDVNALNNEGATALHHAAFLGRVEIVRSLLENGVDKSIKNIRGQTALESVQIPFDDLIPVYDAVSVGLKPLGLVLDYNQIKMARPQIAELLK